MLSDKKSYDEARSALTRAVELDPKYAMAWGGLGRVELRRKQPTPAAEALARAARLEPKNPTYAADLCKAEVDRDPVGAAGVKQCRTALGLEADNALARYMLGKTLVARGECPAAKTELGRFLSLASVKAEAKAGAEALLATCKPGVQQRQQQKAH